MKPRYAISQVLIVALLASLAARAQTPAAIPDRPEKLSFPPLKYDPPNPADYRVKLAAGPVAYLVPDRSCPLVNIVVLVRAPGYAVPPGKEYLNSMVASLLTRGGTRTQSALDLEERLDFLAANLNSSAGDTHATVSLNVLTSHLDEGLSILREVLSEPRFQSDRISLLKQQELQDMRQRNDDSSDIEARERGFLAFGDDFFTNRYPTAASVNSITREDLIAFHREWYHPANFIIAVSGDFDRAAMQQKLEKLLGDWPFKGQTAPPVPADTHFAAPGIYLVNKDVNQGRVSLMLPGILRDNPDHFAVAIMNDILGGGGFTARITKRVRSDEGLAYSAGSSFPGGIYYPLTFRASFQSKARTVTYALSLVIEEMKRIASAPVSAAELDTAKRSFIDAFPQAFATADQVASTFASDELTGRFAKHPNYYQTYREKIAAVTAADVERVAKKYLLPDKAVILIVGPKQEILKGYPDHPLTLQSLSPGLLKDLPLRDPMTMKPVIP
jgi:predicted Zn-dependent peptidase